MSYECGFVRLSSSGVVPYENSCFGYEQSRPSDMGHCRPGNVPRVGTPVLQVSAHGNVAPPAKLIGFNHDSPKS